MDQELIRQRYDIIKNIEHITMLPDSPFKRREMRIFNLQLSRLDEANPDLRDEVDNWVASLNQE
jgi:hypothetical protein